MEEEEMKELMIEHLEGNLTGELKEFVAKHIEKDEKWKLEYTKLKELVEIIDNSSELVPPDSLKLDFEKMLSVEISNKGQVDPEVKETKTIYWNSHKMWLQIAASVTILLGGYIIGTNLTSNSNQKELMALRSEMEVTRKLVLSSLQNQSASSRISAVNASYKIKTIDNSIINALIKTMNTDENANVRLAAIEALTVMVAEEKVLEALIASLSTQDKPVVQIALINLMVDLKEKRAIQSLQKIIDSNTSIDVVIDEANYGLFKLS